MADVRRATGPAWVDEGQGAIPVPVATVLEERQEEEAKVKRSEYRLIERVWVTDHVSHVSHKDLLKLSHLGCCPLFSDLSEVSFKGLVGLVKVSHLSLHLLSDLPVVVVLHRHVSQFRVMFEGLNRQLYDEMRDVKLLLQLYT